MISHERKTLLASECARIDASRSPNATGLNCILGLDDNLVAAA